MATPGPRTTGQCSSRERNPPQDHLAHSPPGSPIHPHLLRGLRAPSAGPAPCPPSRHVADQVCAARVPAVGRERRGPPGLGHRSHARTHRPRGQVEREGLQRFPSARVEPTPLAPPRRTPSSPTDLPGLERGDRNLDPRPGYWSGGGGSGGSTSPQTSLDQPLPLQPSAHSTPPAEVPSPGKWDRTRAIHCKFCL